MLGLVALVVAGGTGRADEGSGGSPGMKRVLTLGLGVGGTTEYEGANEYRPVPIIIARLRVGNRYSIGTDGSGLQADLVGSRFIEAGPALGFRFRRGGNVSDPVIALLPEVNRAIELGGFLNLNFPFPVGGNKRDALTFGARFLQDVTGAHQGYTVQGSVRYRGLVRENLVIQAGPFVTYASDDFASTYYDVTAAGAVASGLPAFDASSGLKDVGFEVNSRVMLRGKWSLNTIASHRRFVGDAADSPVVDIRGSDGVWFGGAALAYSF